IRWILPWGLTFIWVISVWRSLIDWVNGYPVAGVCGNWNWNLSVLIVALPFVMLLWWRYSAGVNGVVRKLLLFLPLVLTLLVGIVSNFSKGAVLGGVVALIFLAGARLKWFKNYFSLLKILSGAVLLLLLLAAVGQIFFAARLEAFLNSDVRLNLWRAAVEYIAGHPFGGGVGWYESFIVPYIPLEYYNSPFAAARNPHPHNWLLFLAAERGWLFAVTALIFALTVIFRQLLVLSRQWSWTQAALVFGLMVLFVHAQVDVVDLEYPTNLMLVTLFGVAGGGLLAEPGERVIPIRNIWRNLAAVVALVVFFCGVVAAYAGLRSSWLLRQGDLDFSGGDYVSAGKCFEESYNLRPTPDALYRMQNLLLTLKDYDAVLKLNSEYKQLGYLYFMRHDLLSAIAAGKKGDLVGALELLEADLKRCPLSVAARIVKINILLASGDAEGAGKLEKELDALLLKRKLTVKDIPLLMNNYEFDLNNHQLQEYKKQQTIQP
ncbi:MAG: O-antigen ligase family protein, partial [Victivallaceae bacterium]